VGIKNFFGGLDPYLLLSILEKKILDPNFTNLIKKSIKAGYFEFRFNERDIVRIPQGSIISPILSNIYLNLLDQFIEKKKLRFDLNKRTKNYTRYEHSKYLRKNNLVVDRSDPNYKRLNYVRCADELLIGIRASYKDAVSVFNETLQFCESINLKVNLENSEIFSINKKFMFLGTSIFRSKPPKYKKRTNTIQKFSSKIQLNVPIQYINKKLKRTKFLIFNKPNPRYL